MFWIEGYCTTLPSKEGIGDDRARSWKNEGHRWTKYDVNVDTTVVRILLVASISPSEFVIEWVPDILPLPSVE